MGSEPAAGIDALLAHRAWVAALIPLAGVRWGTGATTGGAIMAGKAAVATAVAAAAVLGGVAGGISVRVASGGGGGEGVELASARAEIRELRGRLESVEGRPAATGQVPAPSPSPAPGPDLAIQQHLAAQDRRIADLERSLAEARAKPREVLPGEETPGQRTERERREKEAVERLAKGKAAIADLQSRIDELRRQALDRSLADPDRIAALAKLRFLPKGIDREVVLGMIAFFREAAEAGTRDGILRELHSVVDPELKALFLEVLRSDPDERVRERAARDIDTYLDDPVVVQALEVARDGDSSEKVRASAAKTLEAHRKP